MAFESGRDVSAGAVIKRLAVTVKGRVQGVGYRYFTREHARAFGLTGWVRNDAAGSVSMEVQGEGDRLESFCAILRDGPVMSRIADMKKSEIPVVKGETDFIVRHS